MTLPLEVVTRDHRNVLSMLYRTELTATDPGHVAALLEVPLGPWAAGAPAGESPAIGPRTADVAFPFAHAIHLKARAVGTLPLSPKQEARLRESMLDDLKKCANVLFPDVRPPLVSSAAADVAQSIPTDLRRVGWHDQPLFDEGRRTFHWDHVTPLAQLRNRLAEAETVEHVRDLIAAQLHVAWITKEESEALAAAGFKSKRPQPWAAYELAGIELIDKPVLPMPGPATPTSEPMGEFDARRAGIHLMEAVAHLHAQGYQNLRVFPGMSASGMYWRLAIAAQEHFSPTGELRNFDVGFVYSTSLGGTIDGVELGSSPLPEVADLILQRIPTVAPRRDWAYAGWYQELMQLVHRQWALPIAYADCFDAASGWAIGWGSGVRMPWPPGI